MYKLIVAALLKFVEKILPRGYYVQGDPLFLVHGSTEAIPTITHYPDESRNFNASLYGNRYKPMRDINRWLLLRLALNMSLKLEDGDYAEVGTYHGVSAKIMYRHMPLHSALYCFDTFEGFASSDIEIEAARTGIMVSSNDFSKTSIEFVEDLVRDGDSSKFLALRKGRFPETFEGLEGMKWRFVHLDCDLYEPIRAGLELFWPKMVKGAVVVVHDYNSSFKGVKIAVDEFCKRENAIAIPWIDQCGSVLIVKP